MNNQPKRPSPPMLNVESKQINVQFMPSDEFIGAVLRLSNSDDFQLIVKEMEIRIPELAIASAHINQERFSTWVQGRVQELRDIMVVFKEAETIMQKRRTGAMMAAAAEKAM